MKEKWISKLPCITNPAEILPEIASMLEQHNTNPELWLVLPLLVTWQWEHINRPGPSAWHGSIKTAKDKLIFTSKFPIRDSIAPQMPNDIADALARNHVMVHSVLKRKSWELSCTYTTFAIYKWQKLSSSSLSNALYTVLSLINKLQSDLTSLSNELALTNQGVVTMMEEAILLAEGAGTKKPLDEWISSNRNLLERLKQKEAALQHADRLATIGRMVAGVAHEINNPLTFIKINAELLSRRLQGQDEHARPIKALHQGVERISNIVSSLKRFSRQEPKEKTCVNLVSCLDTAWMLVSSDQNFVNNISLDVSLAPSLCVLGNYQQLEQVFINLIQNSIHAIRVASREFGWIRVYADKQSAHDKWLTLTIEDNGCGIPTNKLSKVFDPFYSNQSGGTGLGLSVVHGIVTEHGGNISVASTLDKGTKFTITLPIWQQDGDEIAFRPFRT